jgi:hypothetical protein
MDYAWFDFVGNVGVVLILLTYLLLQTGRVSSRSAIYSALNALGALLIMVSLCFEFNLSAFIIEFFWLLISLVGLARIKRDAPHAIS